MGTFALTPGMLLGLVGVFIVARAVLTVRAVRTNTQGRATTFAREYLDPFIYAGIAAFLLITFVARTYYIPSGSMIPTLQIGDVLLVNKFEYRFHKPSEGDVVVFPPPIPTSDDFIKRVIGRPGDTLRIQSGVVYLNGKRLGEPYINDPPAYNLAIRNYGIYVQEPGGAYERIDPSQGNIPPRKDWTAPDRIPANCYFMMGDNRNDSEDSHVWGFAQLSGTFRSGPREGAPAHFTGHAFLIFWPLSRARILWR
ncbi:MAG TPA: signal peptidase I [Candidatus Baltobacteraceae bacterium]|nr:signal peptidase I [Candidatus Baltobacteraceae bacterium]